METLPFEIAETAHALRRAFGRRAAALGVTGAQWKVLFRLSRMPGMRQVDLAEALDVEPITLCRIVDRLEAAGLVERVGDPDDRRAWRLHVTAKAVPLVEQLRALGDVLMGEAFSGIEVAELEQVRRILARMRENISGADSNPQLRGTA